MAEEAKRFWGLLELMGHVKIAGELSEETFGGTTLIRVDVPEVPEEQVNFYGSTRTLPAVPGFTKFYGGSAVYCITPMSEQACMRVIRQTRTVPVQGVDLTVKTVEAPKQLAAPMSENEILKRAAELLEQSGFESTSSLVYAASEEISGLADGDSDDEIPY